MVKFLRVVAVLFCWTLLNCPIPSSKISSPSKDSIEGVENKVKNTITVIGNELFLGGKTYKCAVGSGGIKGEKVEGDKATPSGVYPIREIWYRKDAINLDLSRISIPVHAIHEDDGWCDDSKDPAYNTHVKIPYPASHEELKRKDKLYDLLLVVGYNDDKPIPGKGSAIFVHVARIKDGEYMPTAGCISLKREELEEIIYKLGKEPFIDIKASKESQNLGLPPYRR